jgi:CRP-like cAMP-binding protein
MLKQTKSPRSRHVSTNPSLTKPSSTSPKPSPFNTKRNPLANKILRGLPREEYKSVFPTLEWVDLPIHTVLSQEVKPIEHGYFINSGLASILAIVAKGKSVEVGLMGADGFVGLPLVVGFKSSPTRAIVQIHGSAFRIRAKDLVRLLAQCPELERRLQRHSQQTSLQSTQIAACNQLHYVSQRLTRWLLMSQDRIVGDVVGLTQESLALILGTRRASVNIAMGELQRAGLISYTRGAVRIEDRAGLKLATCECYVAIKRQSEMWDSESAERP